MTEKQLLKKLGLKIKQLRTEKGFSQNAFGAEVDMEKSNISRLEAGNVNARIGTYKRVAEALSITLPELLDIK